MSRIVVEGFHRTDDDGRSVTYTGRMTDPESLERELREQGVYGPMGSQVASPSFVVAWLNEPSQHTPGNNLGTVAVGSDDGMDLATVERAIRMLESVRDGLRETGHHDWEASRPLAV